MTDDKNKISKYRNKLVTDFPNLKINSINIIGSGWDHDAIEVNGDTVFRMPRGVHERDSTIESEISLLRMMKSNLLVQIPDPLYISPDHEYFGYPKVKGVLLDELIKGFSDKDWHQLMLDWVNIAHQIHASITVDSARKLKIPSFIQPGPNAAEKIFNTKGVKKEILDFATQTIEQYKKLDPDNLHYVLIHNDLQFHNILANPETKRISGLIDWTDACIGPLSREFAISEWWAKPDLLEEVTSLYERQTGQIVDVEQVIMWRNLEELADYAENIELGQTVQAHKTLERIEQLADDAISLM